MSGPSSAIAEKFRLAVTLHERGQLERAEALYREILEARPQDPDVLHMLGMAVGQGGRAEEAVALISRALQLRPRDAAGHASLGVALQHLGRNEEALASIDRALGIQPDLVDALNNRGVSLQHLGRFEEALASFNRALVIKPDYAEALSNRGNALHSLKRFGEALESYGRAVAIRPDYAVALSNAGNSLQQIGRYADAVDAYDRALASRPDYMEAWRNRGNALQELGRPDEALASFQRALALRPADSQALSNCGNLLLDLKRFDDAIGCYARGLEVNPDYPHLLGNWIHTKMRVCDWTGLGLAFAHLGAGVAAGKMLASPFVAVGTPLPLPLQRRCAEMLIQEKFPGTAGGIATTVSPGHERIRLGYFSADFCSHATAYLMAGLFENHDRSRFESIAFSFGPRTRDAMQIRLEAAFDRFIDVREKTDGEIAQLARFHGVDIAVDLKGFTQEGRTGIFAHHAAPLQVNYLGFPGTMGAPYIDYIIADRKVLPREHFGDYAEKVVHLPHTYQPNDSRRVISDQTPRRRDAGLPESGFVFCCFNNNWKFTPDVFAIWMRLLNAVEGSVLWLFEDNPAAGRNLKAAAVQHGISADRLVFAPRLNLPDHLARHRLADLFLDTLPYNAHTTASDALWAGLPVLTRLGDTFAGRVAASLLDAVGLPELITETATEYEALALDLARDGERLLSLKRRLAANRLTSPLFDTRLFAGHIEAAYAAIWQRHQQGLVPDHIVIPP